MEARTFWRSPVTIVAGVVAVLVGIVLVMESRANAPESPGFDAVDLPTDDGMIVTVPGQPPPSVTASPSERALLDATAPPADLSAFGMDHRERNARIEWQVIDAYLCAEILEAETLSGLPVVSDDYGAGAGWLTVSYFDVGDAPTLAELTADYRAPRRRCDWDDPFNEAIEPFDVPLRGDAEAYGFTSGDRGHWVVTPGGGGAGLIWSNGVGADAIESIASALLGDGPLAVGAAEPSGAATTSVP